MPINCPINCLINSEQSCSKNQFMVNSWINSWTFMFQKDGPFAFHLFVFGSSATQNGGLSLFNTHSVRPANTLKTKELRKRHFWLKFLSQGKPLRLKALGENSPNILLTSPPTLHSTRRPKLTLHTLPRNPTSCKVLCRICRPNPTHPTPLIIKL